MSVRHGCRQFWRKSPTAYTSTRTLKGDGLRGVTFEKWEIAFRLEETGGSFPPAYALGCVSDSDPLDENCR